MEMLVRRPLQPRNSNSIPTFLTPQKKPKKPNQKTITVSVSPLTHQKLSSKQNPQIRLKSDQKEPSKETHQNELDSNKETGGELIREVSLAEELEIVRKRKERLRLEKEKTERLLKERDLVLDRAMREMERRAEEQSSIELEIYKVVLLKELRSSSMRVCPIQSLREKEEEKKKKREAQSEGICFVQSLREKEQEKKKKIESEPEESTSASSEITEE